MVSRVMVLLIIGVVGIALIGCGGGEESVAPTPLSSQATVAPAATIATAGTPSGTASGAATPVAVALAPTQIGAETGVLEVRVTDAPPDEVSKIDITISNLAVHRADAGEDEGWLVVSTTSATFDLVELTGVEQVLSTGLFPAGKYTQIRMDVVNVDVTYKDNQGVVTTTSATIPSGKLKVVCGFDVEAGLATTTVLVLDFDAAKSVVLTGNGEVLFKPVVKLLKRKRSGGPGGQDQGPAGQGGQGQGAGGQGGAQGGQGQGAGGQGGAQGGQGQGAGGQAGAQGGQGQGGTDDTTAPVITIAGVSGGATSTEPFTPEFSVSDDVDAPDSLTVTATLNNNPFVSGTQISVVGSYTLVVIAVDTSGNEAEAEVEFEILEE